MHKTQKGGGIMRNPEYEFVSPDAGELTALLEQGYTQITGQALRPGSPEQLFVRWAAGIMVQLRVLMNYVGNQNIPSRAEGENLDALAQLFYAQERPRAKAAVCTQRFHISQAQATAILVPKGTRVTGAGGLVFETAEDGYVPIGETFADVQARCQTLGVAGNGVPPGALDSAVDLYDYYIATENVTTSGGGADEATDEEFCQLMRQSMDAYSCAGARGGYEYFAKQVSTEIADVIANSPSPGVVKLYVLMEGGALAGEEVKGAVLAACNANEVRPLTDLVSVEDAEQAEYNVKFTYYTQTGTGRPAADIRQAVEAAVAEYTAWQSAKLGRDINPDELRERLYHTGIKRVVLAEPVFTVLKNDGKTPPQVAKLGTVTITNGGYEDE